LSRTRASICCHIGDHLIACSVEDGVELRTKRRILGLCFAPAFHSSGRVVARGISFDLFPRRVLSAATGRGREPTRADGQHDATS
jgi:hypothetical protein